MSLHQLPHSVVKLISSTQIISSISSVLKELIENAIDAHATVIDVKLEKYGLDKIEVRDNGLGINKSDVYKVCLPNYTSKIHSFEDLKNLQSYGFRGEALNSLCAVSQLSITTRTDSDDVATTYVFDNNGTVREINPSHQMRGTIVTVTHLFRNVPVRRQFFENSRKAGEELKEAEKLIKLICIIHPKLRVTIAHNKCLIWHKTSVNNLRQSLMQIYPQAVIKNLEEFNHTFDYINLEMMLPKNECNLSVVCQSTHNAILLFVNQRLVKDKKIEKVVCEELLHFFASSLPTNKCPLTVISVKLPSHYLDVNLEPNKMKVFIVDHDEILKQIREALMLHFYKQPVNEVKRLNELPIVESNDTENVAKRRKIDSTLNSIVLSTPEISEVSNTLTFKHDNSVVNKDIINENIVIKSKLFSNNSLSSQNLTEKNNLTNGIIETITDTSHLNSSLDLNYNENEKSETDLTNSSHSESLNDQSRNENNHKNLSVKVAHSYSESLSKENNDENKNLEYILPNVASVNSSPTAYDLVLSEPDSDDSLNLNIAMFNEEFLPSSHDDNKDNRNPDTICLPDKSVSNFVDDLFVSQEGNVEIRLEDVSSSPTHLNSVCRNKNENLYEPVIDHHSVVKSDKMSKEICLTECINTDLVSKIDNQSNINNNSNVVNKSSSEMIDKITLSQWSKGHVMKGNERLESGAYIATKLDLVTKPSTSLLDEDKSSKNNTKLKVFQDEDHSEEMNRSVSSQMGRKDMAGFTHFSRLIKSKILQEMPGLSFTKVASELASRWRSLKEEEKEIYKKDAKVTKNVKLPDNVPKLKPKLLFTKKVYTIHVCIEDIKRSIENTKSCKSKSNICLIGPLESKNKWLFRYKNVVNVLNFSALQKNVLYHRFLCSCSLPLKKLILPIKISVDLLGEELFKSLLSFKISNYEDSSASFISDFRIIQNGFRITVLDSSNETELLLTEVADDSNFQPIQTLKETLQLALYYRDLEDCRPLVVKKILKDKVEKECDESDCPRIEVDMVLKYWIQCMSQKSIYSEEDIIMEELHRLD